MSWFYLLNGSRYDYTFTAVALGRLDAIHVTVIKIHVWDTILCTHEMCLSGDIGTNSSDTWWPILLHMYGIIVIVEYQFKPYTAASACMIVRNYRV